MHERPLLAGRFPPLRQVVSAAHRLAPSGAAGPDGDTSFITGAESGDGAAYQGDPKPQRVSKEAAAALLIADTALSELPIDDAVRIIGYMKPKRLRAGTALIRQGERDATHFMALVLDGTIEVVVREGQARQVLGVMGPGSVIGEMSLVDGEARSASCIATTHAGVALLTRKALGRMMDAEPALAARLVLILMHHLTRRLRETTRRLKVTVQLNDALQAELRQAGGARGEPPPAGAAEFPPDPPFRPGDTVKLYPRGTGC